MTEEPQDRVWYRNVRDGQKGYLLERDGKQYVKLDRPLEEILLPYREAEWRPDREALPLNRYRVGRVSFEADKALCTALGRHQESRREWLGLRDEERIAWVSEGPKGAMRKGLFKLINNFLKPYTVG